MKSSSKKGDPFKGSPLLEKAYLLAERHHRGQLRKGGLPYITHPIAVAKSLLNVGYGEKIAAAALLHDVLEDTGCEYEEMLRVAGPQITRWVVQITDRDKCVPWRVRKTNYLKALRKADKEALAVACADKADNMRGLLAGIKNEGKGFGKNFSANLSDKLKNYENNYRVIAKQHPSCRLLEEYKQSLQQIRSKLGA
jgi:(p)ppGpp synthase/HD superfamily hydrolase